MDLLKRYLFGNYMLQELFIHVEVFLLKFFLCLVAYPALASLYDSKYHFLNFLCSVKNLMISKYAHYQFAFLYLLLLTLVEIK